MILALLSLGFAWAECSPPKLNAMDAPLRAVASALGHVTLEIPLVQSASEPREILAVLNSRGIKATFLPASEWAGRHSGFLQELAKTEHEIGVWFSLREDLGLTSDRSSDPLLSDWVAALRASKKKIRRIANVPPTTLAVAYLPTTGEVAMEGMAFRTILPNERTIDDIPRRARSTTSSAGRARIIGHGPYDDDCGSLLPHWSPAALDRATGAAARGEWVRIGLPSDDIGAPLLARWLDEVVLPNEWSILTADEMTRMLRRGPDPVATSAPDVAVSKSVPIEAWGNIAKTIAHSNPLPREFEAGLNLTEAFYGLTTLLAAPSPPPNVTLGHLSGPYEVASTGLRAPYTLDAEDVRATARQIAQRLGGHIPALVTIGTTTLTAAEALQVMARVYINEPANATPVADPDPFAPGGGWGISSGL
jgi:hypothetical protein